jgi:hypothetical protein
MRAGASPAHCPDDKRRLRLLDEQGDQVVAPGSTPVLAIFWETGMVIGLGGARPATVPPVVDGFVSAN